MARKKARRARAKGKYAKSNYDKLLELAIWAAIILIVIITILYVQLSKRLEVSDVRYAAGELSFKVRNYDNTARNCTAAITAVKNGEIAYSGTIPIGIVDGKQEVLVVQPVEIPAGNVKVDVTVTCKAMAK